MVLLPETDLVMAVEVAQRLCKAITALNIDSCTEPVQVSASVGVTAYRPTSNASLSDLLRVADQALYQAKAAGRNRVMGLTMPEPGVDLPQV